MPYCNYCGNRLDEDNDKSSCSSCRHIEDQEQKRIENETKKTVELQAELSKSELLNQFYIEGLDKSDAKNESHLRNIELRAEHVKKLQAELHIAKKLSRCPCCSKEFTGQGYTKESVHFFCSGCGGKLKIDKKTWNRIIHPTLPKQALKAGQEGKG